MKLLNFYNNFHKGDLHYSREFVKDIATKLNSNNYNYIHNYDEHIFKDINNLSLLKNNNVLNYIHEQIIEDHNNIFVNTWIGQKNFRYLSYNCSLYSNYIMFSDIYKQLNIKLEPIEYYVPTINYDNIEKSGIDAFLNNNKQSKKILISNGNTLSGQALNFDFNPIISSLVVNNPDCCFILTDNSNRIEFKNVFYTSDIIGINTCDLNEISYLSLFCNIIVGRASGAFCFTHVKENIFNKDKVFIGFSYTENESNWFKSNICKQLWYNNSDSNFIIEVINEEIKNLKI